jgi:hypothetical protein
MPHTKVRVVLRVNQEPCPELQGVLDAHLRGVRDDFHGGWLAAVGTTHHERQHKRLNQSSAVPLCTPQQWHRAQASVWSKVGPPAKKLADENCRQLNQSRMRLPTSFGLTPEDSLASFLAEEGRLLPFGPSLHPGPASCSGARICDGNRSLSARASDPASTVRGTLETRHWKRSPNQLRIR